MICCRDYLAVPSLITSVLVFLCFSSPGEKKTPTSFSLSFRSSGYLNPANGFTNVGTKKEKKEDGKESTPTNDDKITTI